MFRTLSKEDLHQHVQIIAWLSIGLNALFLVLAVIGFLFMTTIGLFSGDMEAFGIIAVVGFFMAGVMLVIALPGIVAGIGLLGKKNWGRILALFVSALSLFNFPIGTLFGAYALWVLMQESAVEYFVSEKSPESVSYAG